MESHQKPRMLQGIKLSTQSDTITMLDKGITLQHSVSHNPWQHSHMKRESSMQH